MNCRRHGSKPTLALWMLIAVADIAIVLAAAGLLTTLLIAAFVAVIAGGVFATRTLGGHRPEPAKAVARRRA